MTRNVTALIAFAGIAPAAHAGLGTLNFHADEGDGGAYEIGSTVTWTVSLTGITPGSFIQTIDLNFDASNPTIGTSSAFNDIFSSVLILPDGGTPSGASILGIIAGQSSLLDPLGVVLGDQVLGTFTTHMTEAGTLSYDISDGGQLPAEFVRIGFGSSTPPFIQGRPEVRSDTIFVGNNIPAPAASLVLVPLLRARRRH